MKLIKKINYFFDRISHDLRLLNIKISFVLSIITLAFGILSWIIGGRADKVMLFYIFPRGALSIGIMYFLWALYFFFSGFIIGGVSFGCEKFKRREALKVATFLLLSFLCILSVYTLFFKSLAPLITFIVLTIATIFTFLALLSCIKIYSLWTICIILNLIWLLYNSYISLIIALIN